MPNEANVTALKRQRTTIKASCTRISTYVHAIVSATPSVVAQLQERKSKLEHYWSEYNTVQAQIETQDESEVSDREAFEEGFYALSARIREILNSASQSRVIAAVSPSPSSIPDAPESLTHVRLPKLNLPTFSGKYDEWFPFFDTFNSLIHSNASINNTQKLQYLRASLAGDASSVISSLEISDANYEVAWDLLKERYDNKRVIVNTHIKAIMDLPSMVRENAAELRQIADGAARHVHALNALKRPISHWDDLLVFILSSKLDTLTLREWQSSLTGPDLPTLKQFTEFVSHRCQMLEATGKSISVVTRSPVRRAQPIAKRQSSCVVTVKAKCNYCQGEHSIYYCKEFLSLPIPRRIAEIRNRKICMNCLRSTAHTSNKCTSGNCRICKTKHNTLLHAGAKVAQPHGCDENGLEESSPAGPEKALVTHTSSSVGAKCVMLSTAVVYAYDEKGTRKLCRVLLDCGSQVNFISKKFLDVLGLTSRSLNVSISGVNSTATSSSQTVRVKLQSRLNSYSATIECLVATHITERIPAFTIKRETFNLPLNLKLADPQFHVSSEVDILIGADLFWDLLCIGQLRATTKHPTLQKTRFGWILAGRLGDSPRPTRNVQSFHASVTNAELHDQLNRFWELENSTSGSSSYTSEEAQCEEHFLNNVSQTQQGRYVVKLPLREEVLDTIGDSKDIALKRLYGLERRFKRDPELKKSYTQFLNEYMLLGHMKLVNTQANEGPACYLPHHCVWKTSRLPSKLRVVFDASCKSSTGVSLNDTLRIGPVVQQDLMSILIRFRVFRYVLAADIIKMYRQVLVDPSQTRWQRILWRTHPKSNVDTYELTTVTYGTSSASYLATRCLKHLAEQHSSRYPVGSVHVKRDFYVDDLLTGADTVQDARRIRDEIIQLLRLGGFELSKWASNCPDLLVDIDKPNQNPVTLDGGTDSYILGTQWNQARDALLFSYECQGVQDIITKRHMVSEIAKLFDPLGLLGPILVVAKVIIQDLWQADIQWDESVPQNIHTRWLTFKSQLGNLNHLQISRCVKFNPDPRLTQIHGFCDASERAYGACVYIRTKTRDNEYRSELLCSRSRVAPLRAISLPRLELSAALLLARLIEKVKISTGLTDVQVFLWSDSMITLNWIASPSRRWAIFVANRVGEIQRLTNQKSWRHIASSNNPADALSRGLLPNELINDRVWWHGPIFLQAGEDHWPNSETVHLSEGMPDQKRVVAVAVASDCCIVKNLLNKFSSLSKACRVIAYCLRLLKSHRSRAPTHFVSHDEIFLALKVMSKVVQRQVFHDEHKALSEGNPIRKSSNLLSLSPFIDKEGLIRVGGRLKNSDLSFDARHAILLPRNHELTRRVIEFEHVRSLHAGAQATMATVRQRFWPLSLRSTTRKIIQSCVTCFRAKPTQSEAMMGSLPSCRVTVSRPFTH